MLTGNNPRPPHNHGGALQPQAARRTRRQHRRNGITETPPEHPASPGRDATTYPGRASGRIFIIHGAAQPPLQLLALRNQGVITVRDTGAAAACRL